MMKRLLLTLALFGLLIYPAFAAEVAGVKLPDSLEIGGQQLQLNGYGIRTKYFFDVYAGSLYTGQKVTSTSQVVSSKAGKMIRMDFLYSKLEKEKIVGGFAKGIAKNSPELRNDPEVEKFLGWFDADFIKGDQVDLVIDKENNVSASHNGRKLGATKSANLGKALLLIYLGKKPADEDLKEGMLGLD